MKSDGKQRLSQLFSGAVIGATMLVPGASGGTMAIILGIYDRLVAAVSGLVRRPKENALFLATVGIGGILGMACFSKLLLTLVEAFTKPMMFLFMGAVLGSIPLLLEKAKLTRFSFDAALYLLGGLFFAVLLGGIPQGLFTTAQGSISEYLLLAFAGFLLSVALVLPGISVSYMLLVLGLYETTLAAIHEMRTGYLLVLGLGLAAGTLCTTHLLERAMTRHPQATYLIIAGFVTAALRDVFPGWPRPLEAVWCGLALIIGAGGIYLLTLRVEKGTPGKA